MIFGLLSAGDLFGELALTADYATHTSRNLIVAGLAAATVHELETPVVAPLARLGARRRWGVVWMLKGPSWLRNQLQSNFSSGLAIWDRIHRTARFDADPGNVKVGVVGHLAPRDVALVAILKLPFSDPGLPPSSHA